MERVDDGIGAKRMGRRGRIAAGDEHDGGEPGSPGRLHVGSTVADHDGGGRFGVEARQDAVDADRIGFFGSPAVFPRMQPKALPTPSACNRSRVMASGLLVQRPQATPATRKSRKVSAEPG